MKPRTLKEKVKWRLLRFLGIRPTNFSYSQAGEDRVLQYLFGILRVHPVHYVDLGCNDALHANNTYMFYNQGGSGIVVDPVTDFESQFIKLRPRDTFINAAVGVSGTDSITMYVFENRAMSTLDESLAMQYQALGYPMLCKQVVKQLALTEILMRAEKQIDLLSIDVEGMDLAILKSNDFSRFSPTVICVETVSYRDSQTELHDGDTKTFLESQGYVQYADTHINSIFVKADIYASARKL